MSVTIQCIRSPSYSEEYTEKKNECNRLKEKEKGEQ